MEIILAVGKSWKLQLSILLILISLKSEAQAPGNLDGSDTVCAGNNFGSLNLSGNSGTILRWEISSSTNGPWAVMQYNSANYVYQNLLQTTYFRVISQFGSFPEVSSSVAQIVCQQAPTVFSISSPTFQCLNLSHSASVISNPTINVRWEYSSNNWLSSNLLNPVPSNTVSTPLVTGSYQLRAYIASSFCPYVYSNTITVQAASASNAGTIGGVNALCSNANTCTLSLTNYTGNVIGWENANAQAGPFTPIPGTSGLSSLPLANLLQSSYYRVKVQNGTCAISTSSTHTINLTQPTVPGFIVGTASVCSGQTNATLNLLGSNTSSNIWEKFTGSTWQNIASNVSSLTIASPTLSANYRATVQNGICPAATSNTHVLVVYPKPQVSFTCSNSCLQTATNFSTSGTNIYLAQWSFGDGNTSSFFSPAHTYSTVGTYTPSLKCYSQFGCKDSAATTISIYALPQAGFLNSDSLCGSLPYSFISTASSTTGSISTVSYNFGDGATSSLAQSTHSYSIAGSYLVTQSVTSSFGCASALQKSILVLPVPSASFSAPNTCVNQAVAFQNYSLLNNGFMTYKWLFGNGDSSVSTFANYQFPLAGTYNVKLTTKSNLGCENSIIKPLSIHALPTVNLSQYSTCATQSILISAQITPTNFIASSVFSLGDGTNANSSSLNHAYMLPGIYPLTLKITTDSSCVLQVSSQITVHPKPHADIAEFAFCKASTPIITNLSSITSGSLQYLWSLNNSTVYAQALPPLNALSEGQHSLNLVAISPLGCSDTIHKLILVNPLPILSLSNYTTCQNSLLNIMPTSSIITGSIVSYEWNVNGKYLSSENSLQATTLPNGAHTISLISTSDKQCKSNATTSVEVYPLAVANYTTALACSRQPFQITNTTKGTANNYTSYWTLDTIKRTQQNLSLAQLSAGYHTVKLLTITDKGCRDSLQQKLYVAAAPSLLVEADTLLNLGEQSYLKAQGANSYTWYPSEYLSDAFSPNTLFTAQASITYTLLAQSQEGCESRLTLPIRVLKNYRLEIFNIITLNDNTLNDHFHINNITSYPNNKVLVYDQNNQIVFEQNNYQNTWQGRSTGGELLAPGTYYYRISFEGEEKLYTGTLLLVKE